MMNGAALELGSIAGSRASGSGRIMGAQTSVHNELTEVRGFVESDRRFGSKERIWTFPKDRLR